MFWSYRDIQFLSDVIEDCEFKNMIFMDFTLKGKEFGNVSTSKTNTRRERVGRSCSFHHIALHARDDMITKKIEQTSIHCCTRPYLTPARRMAFKRGFPKSSMVMKVASAWMAFTGTPASRMVTTLSGVYTSSIEVRA